MQTSQWIYVSFYEYCKNLINSRKKNVFLWTLSSKKYRMKINLHEKSKMICCVLKKNITYFRIVWDENCYDKIMMIFMQNILITTKFLIWFVKNIDDRTLRKMFANIWSYASNVHKLNLLNINFMNYWNFCLSSKNLNKIELWISLQICRQVDYEVLCMTQY